MIRLFYVLIYITMSYAEVLMDCPNGDYTRTPIGCFQTMLSVSSVKTLLFDNNYAYNVTFSNMTQQKYCGLACYGLGTSYYILHNKSGCACVTVDSPLTLTASSSCLKAKKCNTSAPDSVYCSNNSPELGAWWFCTPKSVCPKVQLPDGWFSGNILNIQCTNAEFDSYLEGDFLERRCKYAPDECLQASSYLRCQDGAWVNDGETSNPICLPCSEAPTNCSSIGKVCNPVLPPIGTCQHTNLTAMDDNSPWNGGDAEPLPSSQVYSLLNITNYSPKERPTNTTVLAGHGPTPISIAVTVQEVQAVSELTSSLDLDLFFYLSWMDPRLNWNNLDVVGPPGSFFQLTDSTDQRQLWVPPIYVGNARSVEKANSQQESSVTFLNSNGRASSTFRISATVTCKMNLRNFPFDSQVCPIYFGIFGYYDKQVKLNWAVPKMFSSSNPTTPFTLNSKISLSTWKIKKFNISTPPASATDDAVCSKFRTCLLAKVELERKVSFYVVDTFLPTLIILASSCLSFWINPENVPARVSMGLTLFLTLQATNLNIRNKLPNVTYVKAIDIWLFFAQGCLFLGLLEFLLIHVIINGYVDPPGPLMSRKQNRSVQTSDNSECHKDANKNLRRSTALKIDKIARIVFPAGICIFLSIYFSAYLT